MTPMTEEDYRWMEIRRIYLELAAAGLARINPTSVNLEECWNTAEALFAYAESKRPKSSN